MPINKKIIFTTVLAVTALSATIFVIKNQQLHKENKKLVKQFSSEKEILVAQIDEMLIKNDHLKNENKQLRAEKRNLIESANKRNQKNDINVRFVSEKTTEGQIYNLKLRNEELKKEVVEIQNQILVNNNKITELEKTPIADKSKLKKLTAVNVNARGVRVMSDLYKKQKEHKIQEIRVCFTLQENEFVGVGHKKIYIQIVNPYNQIISVDNEEIVDSNGNKLKYSSKINAMYNQKDTDVCAYVDLEKNRTVKGTYKVNLFYGFEKIGSTTYQYN